MSTNPQSGVTTLQIIVILAIAAVIFGIASTFTPNNQPEAEGVAATSADMNETQSPIENMADSMAESETADMVEVVSQRNSDMDSLASDTEEDLDTMDAVSEQDTSGLEAQAEVSADLSATSGIAPTSPGTFTDYSADKLALAENGTVVLFFHANWCPSCRGLENDINANLSSLPANTHILKLDYDTETELKKKYGVVRQHTMVVVNADGSEVKKLTGLTNTLEQVTNQL